MVGSRQDWAGAVVEWRCRSEARALRQLAQGDIVFLGRVADLTGRHVAEAYADGGVEAAICHSDDVSFGLRDNQSGHVVCVRDRCGVHPLYYASRPGDVFAFASAIEPLLALPGIGRRLNRLKAAIYLHGPAYDGFDDTLTFFEGVYRLPAGHSLVATPGGVKVRRYFSYEHVEEFDELSPAELSEEFNRRFTTAIRKRAPGAGLLLSGGLKSAAIATVATSLLPPRQKLPCWSFVPVDPPGWQWPDDPRPAIASLSQRLSLEVHLVGWPDSRLLSGGDYYPEVREKPRWFYIREDEAAAMEGAERAGLTALMVGTGGQWLPIFRRPKALAWAALRSGDWTAIWRTAQRSSASLPRALARIAKHDILNPALTPLLPRWLGNRLLGSPEPLVLNAQRKLLRPAFLAETGATEWLQERMRRISTDFRENALWGMIRGQLQQHLENWALLGRCHGLEFRYPFLDTDVVDFCFRLPASYYFGGDPQRVLREAMRNVLPEPIRMRESRLSSVVDWAYRKVQLYPLERIRLEQLEKHSLLTTMLDLSQVRTALDQFPAEATVQHTLANKGYGAAAELLTPGGIATSVGHLWTFAQFLDHNGFA